MRARYEVIFKPDGGYYIKDLGPWHSHPTITNDAENVVQEVVRNIGDCDQIEYVDSEGERGLLLVKRGKLAGFAPVAAILLLCLFFCGACAPEPPRVDTDSQGTNFIVTNNAVWQHTWRYSDTYIFVSTNVSTVQ